MTLNKTNRDFQNLVVFLIHVIFKFCFWAREGLENAPEPRGDVLAKFGPKRSHLDPAQAHFYSFGDLILRTTLPMSTLISLNLPSTLLFDPIIPLAYSASPS